MNSPNSVALTVNLSVDRPGYFNFSSQVTIPSGQDHVDLAISGIQADPTPPVTLSASAAGHASGSTTQVTVRILRIQMTPAILVNPGQATNLQIVLSDPAPVGGVTITLASSSTAIATVVPRTMVPVRNPFWMPIFERFWVWTSSLAVACSR